MLLKQQGTEKFWLKLPFSGLPVQRNLNAYDVPDAILRVGA